MRKTAEKNNESFEKIYEGLNRAQRSAVDQIEGPVMVIAGPGTGKTHILAARIGKILLETDVAPSNILCLTFTDAGVKAMRKRLIQFIGAAAHRVHIFTFHSFCNKVIKENLENFGKQDLEPITELEKIELIQSILSELPIRNPLVRGKENNISFYTNHLMDLFRKMKSEHWEPEFLIQRIEAHLKDLPNQEGYRYKRNSKTYKKGDVKQAKLDQEQWRMQLLIAGIKLFPRYLVKMEQWRRYDYDDMILWVLKAFERDDFLLRSYQEQYQYFLVDEFQDTNGAQSEILEKLIDFWEDPNVFIVGDDDQSIYEFQGARLKNLTNFFDKYSRNIELIVLTDNYRSSQNILNSAKKLIDHNELRITKRLSEIAIDKDLLAKNPDFAAAKMKTSIVQYQNRLQEVTDIVNQVESLKIKDFNLEDIAIIYAEHKQSRLLIELLTKRGIPFQTRKKVNLLELPLIMRLNNFLQYLQTELKRSFSGEALLFQILHYDFWKISPLDLAKLSLFFAQQKELFHWRTMICDKDFLNQLDLKDPEIILQTGQLINTFLTDLSSMSLPYFIEKLINRSGILSTAMESKDKITLVQQLYSFLEFVKNETNRNPNLDLERLLDVFDNFEKNRIILDFDLSLNSEKGIQLITAHSAKGLEFEKVFLLDCVSNSWEPKNSNARFQFGLPSTITYSTEEDALEARRRLFYVAMTRAKLDLHISYASNDEKGKELQRAIFLDEIILTEKLEVKEKEVKTEKVLSSEVQLLEEQLKSHYANFDQETLRTLVENFVLSVSSLSRYLDCPLSFYYEYILKVPSIYSEAAIFGSVMHKVFQWIFEQMLKSKRKEFPDIEKTLVKFENEMLRKRGFFESGSFKRRIDSGKYQLIENHKQNIDIWAKEVQLELAIQNVIVGNVPISGIIDKVEIIDKSQYVVVDYKTGNLQQGGNRPPTTSKPGGGAYWRQLVFYKLLMESFRPEIKVVKGQIVLVKPNKYGQLEQVDICFSEKDVSIMKELITKTYLSIQNLEFDGCGEEDCKWCYFVKNDLKNNSWTENQIEALDDSF